MRFAHFRPLIVLLPAVLASTACGSGAAHEEKAKLPPPHFGTEHEPQDAANAATVGSAGSTSSGAAGTLEARRRSTLSPKVGGVVTKVHVRDGDLVAEDAPLVTLDAEDFALRTRQASAGHDAAKAAYAAAEADWKRAKALLADKAMPQAQFDAADARYQGARAQLAQAEVGMAMARKSERDAVIRAPYQGVVVRRYVSEGEYAAQMPPTNLVTIEETGVFDLRVYVPADRAAGVRTGDPAAVKLAGIPAEVRGTVLQVIPPAGDARGTSAVLVEVPDPDGILRPGMTAEARLQPRGATNRGSK